jgi:hypothetical protein
MATYPFKIGRFFSTPRQNQLAQRIEEYLNSKVSEDEAETQTYFYSEIADDLGADENEVRDILYAVDHGSNGITIYRHS